MSLVKEKPSIRDLLVSKREDSESVPRQLRSVLSDLIGKNVRITDFSDGPDATTQFWPSDHFRPLEDITVEEMMGILNLLRGSWLENGDEVTVGRFISTQTMEVVGSGGDRMYVEANLIVPLPKFVGPRRMRRFVESADRSRYLATEPLNEERRVVAYEPHIIDVSGRVERFAVEVINF